MRTRVVLLFREYPADHHPVQEPRQILDQGIALSGAPQALGGIVIAMIVFTPEEFQR